MENGKQEKGCAARSCPCGEHTEHTCGSGGAAAGSGTAAGGTCSACGTGKKDGKCGCA